MQTPQSVLTISYCLTLGCTTLLINIFSTCKNGNNAEMGPPFLQPSPMKHINKRRMEEWSFAAKDSQHFDQSRQSAAIWAHEYVHHALSCLLELCVALGHSRLFFFLRHAIACNSTNPKQRSPTPRAHTSHWLRSDILSPLYYAVDPSTLRRNTIKLILVRAVSNGWRLPNRSTCRHCTASEWRNCCVWLIEWGATKWLRK